MMNRKKLLGVFFLFFLVCNSIGAVAGTNWHSETFGGSVTVEEPPATVTWHSETFGGSVIVEETPDAPGTNLSWVSRSFGGSVIVEEVLPPGINISWVSRSFGGSVIVEGAYAGDWSDWWVLGFYGFAPTASDISPVDGAIDIYHGNIIISADFVDGDGNDMNISWYWFDNSTLIGQNNSVGNGTYSQTITGKYQETINWSINVTDGENWNNYTLSFTVEDLIPVTSLTVANYDTNGINLSWSKTGNVTNTYIRYSKTGYPTSITDGTFLVNTTNTSYNHSGLHAGTRYYYSIWSYNSSDNVYSNNYVYDDNYTNPGRPNDFLIASQSMSSIGLQWSKGINATNTVVFYNASGEMGYPNRNNGTLAYNSTGSSTTVSGLTDNETYWFTAYSFNPSSGLWSILNSTVSGQTVAAAGSPSNLDVSRYNHNQLNLSWTKGVVDDKTVIVRRTGSYPTTYNDGTKVYNGSASSYKDTGLTPATKYYYRAWGWNDEEYSSGYSSDTNITRPQPPQDFQGLIVGGVQLDITWSKGTGAVYTHIRNNTGVYPENVSDGNLVYNNTGTSTSVVGVSSIEYYRAWSYALVDGEHVYSLPADLLWGGLEINVYKEDNPSIEIGNYTVFITNGDASETYENTSQNNPFRIDVSEVPYGDNIIIQISKQGYHTRSKTMDLEPNTWYIVNFYLPPSTEGSPPDESDEDWYVNESDLDNETTASHYIITVRDTASNAVENVLVTIKKYINTTEEYETIVATYTDSAGQIDVDLIPGTVYYVVLTKTGYVTTYSYWTPSPIVYADDAAKSFVITPESPDYTDEINIGDCFSFSGEKNDTHAFVNFSCNCDTLYNFSIWIYEIEHGSGNISYFGSYNYTGNTSANISFVMDTSCNYQISFYLNHSVFGGFWSSLYITNYEPPTSVDEFDDLFTDVFGGNSLTWSGLFGIIVLLAGLFSFGQRGAGISLVLVGFVMLGFNVVFGLLLLNVTICILIVLFGVLVQWKIERSVR